ncbi:MAG: hypothetical protein KC636_25955 [Myxococcales bacterium]|nr:hypothetical protein [Myxococcales bacterium]
MKTTHAHTSLLTRGLRLVSVGFFGVIAVIAPLRSAHADGIPLALADDFANYGGPYAPAEAHFEGDLAVISGLITLRSYDPDDWVEGLVIGAVPEGLEPVERVRFNLDQHAETATVDVTPEGDIIYLGGGDPDYRWLSLSGIVYATLPASEQSSISLSAPKLTGVSGFQAARYHAEGDLISVGGMVRFPSPTYWSWYTGDVIARITGGACPSKRLIFTVSNGHSDARVDITEGCDIVFVDGNPEAPAGSWASLSGLTFSRASTPLEPCPGVENYAKGNYQGLSYGREGQLVTLSGLVERTDGDWVSGDVIGVLPEEHAPAKRLIFSVNQHGRTARVDVHPNGNIEYVKGDSARSWLSLSGIVFAAGD